MAYSQQPCYIQHKSVAQCQFESCTDNECTYTTIYLSPEPPSTCAVGECKTFDNGCVAVTTTTDCSISDTEWDSYAIGDNVTCTTWNANNTCNGNVIVNDFETEEPQSTTSTSNDATSGDTNICYIQAQYYVTCTSESCTNDDCTQLTTLFTPNYDTSCAINECDTFDNGCVSVSLISECATTHDLDVYDVGDSVYCETWSNDDDTCYGNVKVVDGGNIASYSLIMTLTVISLSLV